MDISAVMVSTREPGEDVPHTIALFQDLGEVEENKHLQYLVDIGVRVEADLVILESVS